MCFTAVLKICCCALFPSARPFRKKKKKLCHSYDPEQPAAIDLDSGCTGVIADGDLVVKDWDEPPLHLLCAKREWRKTVISILRKKQQLRDLDSTEKQEAAQPSAEVPANLADF